LYTLYEIGLGLTKMLATFLPHITEEVYQTYYKELDGKSSLHISSWPEEIIMDEDAQIKGEIAKDVIAALRNWKSELGLALNSELNLVEIVAGDKIDLFSETKDDITKTVRAKELNIVDSVQIEERPVSVKPKYAQIGPKFKQNANEIGNILKSADAQAVFKGISGDGYEITLKSGEKAQITGDLVEIEMAKKIHGKELSAISVGEFTVLVEK
jgi:valyl-tRNA synthetase